MVLVGLFFCNEKGRSPWETWSCGEKALGGGGQRLDWKEDGVVWGECVV